MLIFFVFIKYMKMCRKGCLRLRSNMKTPIYYKIACLFLALLLLTATVATETFASGEFSRQSSCSLQITNEVVNLDETALTQEQLDQGFNFAVTFSDGGTYPYTIGEGEATDLSRGGTLTLRHGQTAMFSGLPVGVLYTVVEMPVVGHTIGSSGHTGNITQEGAVAAFQNRYDGVEKLPGDLLVHNEVVGDTVDMEQTFPFVVVFSDGGSYSYTIDGGEVQTLTSGDIIALGHDETALFQELPEGLAYQVTRAAKENQDYKAGIEEVKGVIKSENVAQAEFYLYPGSDQAKETEQETNVSGSLTIQNQVALQYEGYESLDYVIDTQKEFDYTLTFSDGGAYEYAVDGGEAQMFTSGGRLSLRYGQTARFTDVPPQVTYHIIEDDYSGEGYITSVDEISGRIVARQTVGAVFYNYRMPPANEEVPQNTILTVHKAMEGSVPKEEEVRGYAFSIIIDGESTDFTLKRDEEKTFSIPAGSIFQVVEQDSFLGGGILSKVTNGYGTAIGENLECVMTTTYVGTAHNKEKSGEHTVPGNDTDYSGTGKIDPNDPNGALKTSVKVNPKTADTGSLKIWLGVIVGGGALRLVLRIFGKNSKKKRWFN